MARSTLSGTWSDIKASLTSMVRNLLPLKGVIGGIFAIACEPFPPSLRRDRDRPPSGQPASAASDAVPHYHPRRRALHRRAARPGPAAAARSRRRRGGPGLAARLDRPARPVGAVRGRVRRLRPPVPVGGRGDRIRDRRARSEGRAAGGLVLPGRGGGRRAGRLPHRRELRHRAHRRRPGARAGSPRCSCSSCSPSPGAGCGPAPSPSCCWWACWSAWWWWRWRGRRDQSARPTGRRSHRTAGSRWRTRPRS